MKLPCESWAGGGRPYDPGILLAVLLNPPEATSGARTRGAVERARRVLGYSSVQIVNLCSLATASVSELDVVGTRDSWVRAREDVTRHLPNASGLLAGWGLAGLSGDSRANRQEQVNWLYAAAREAAFDRIWMVGGEPRHPSRWHQYTAGKYGRTSGGTFETRLGEVLVAVPLADLLTR